MSLKRYSKPISTVAARASVVKACQQMRRRNAGAIVVLSDDNQPIGLLTDRDVALRVVGEGRAPGQTLVADVMTPGLLTIPATASIQEASELMRKRGVRRIPITGPEGAVIGLVTLDDLVLLLGIELGNLAGAIFGEISAECSEPSPQHV